MICPKHNDPLKIYCLTCYQVICRDCTFSEMHNKHQFQLISECYPKHHQQIQDDLNLLEHKLADLNTTVTALVTRERDVIQQGEQIKEQIHTHAQKLIDKVQMSERNLLQQVDTVVKQKRQLLAKQREQAKRAQTQLKSCQEGVQKILKEFSQLQVMMEKENTLHKMKTVSQHIDPTVFQPIEEADTKLTLTDNIASEIGGMTSVRFREAVLEKMPLCLPNTLSTATLTLLSHDGSPFSLPPSLISGKLSSPGDGQPIECDINQTQQGKYNISFTPTTTGAYELIVQVGGVDISGSPFTLPVLPSSVMRGKSVKTITGLKNPWGLAACDNGDVVVAERSADRVTIMNKEGKKVRSFGTKGQFTSPCGVAISIDRHILVTDKHRLLKLTFRGECVNSFDSRNSQLQLNNPCDLVVHPTTGQIFVANENNNCIQVFNNDLTFSHTITVHGDQTLIFPSDVALDSGGHLYVAEWKNHTIMKLTTTGQYITRFGSWGSAPGQLNCPFSLTISNNLVYVGDFGNHRVSVFDTKGTYVCCFGKRGSGEGEFHHPIGITADANHTLYVSDHLNQRIMIY